MPSTGPALVVLLFWWTLIAPLASYYRCGRRIADAQHAARLPRTCNGAVGAALMLVAGLGTVYFQIELNKIYDVYGSAKQEPTCRSTISADRSANLLWRTA